MKRNIDELGRIVIPAEMRKQLHMNGGDTVNIEIVRNKLVISNPDEVDYKNIMEELEEWLANNKVSTVEEILDKLQSLKRVDR